MDAISGVSLFARLYTGRRRKDDVAGCRRTEKAATCAGPRFTIRRGSRLKHESNSQNKPILGSLIRLLPAIFSVRDERPRFERS